ncbi:MAG: proton-conducting transporter membrane subunit [Candidatus Limnocylindrales bacterium]|jgi:NADH-quinone oxidoreductase subunit N
MSLLVFLVICGIGAAVGLAARSSRWLGRLVGLVCLLLAFAAALTIGPTTSLTIGDVTLAGTSYSGFFLACAAGSGLLLCVVGLASGWPDELAPAALASLAGLAIAFTAADPGVALAAGAAAATAGALLIVRTAPRDAEGDGRLAEIRTIGLVAAGLGFAAITVARPPWNGRDDGPIFALAFLILGLALAVRSGAVPFHVPAARLGRTAAPLSPAMLLVWIPAGLAVLAISWSATTLGIQSDWLNASIAVVQVVAVATLVLGPLAALVHDELEEVVAYSIVTDAGFVLLAMAARTDSAAEPARLWLIVFIAAKTGLVAWAAGLSRAFGTSNVPRLRGWLRRTPMLGLALAVIAVATIGWPGSPVYEARSTLIRLGLPSGLQFLFPVSIALALACYARLLLIGLRSATEDVRLARSELPRWPAVGRRPSADAAVAATAMTLASGAEPGGEPEASAGVGDRVAAAWRLNRTTGVSLVIVAGAALSAALAFGGLGTSNASRSGIPLDAAAHTTPTRAPTQAPPRLPTPTPLPSLAPRPTPEPSGAVGPSQSIPPSFSPAPITTSAPAQPNTD